MLLVSLLSISIHQILPKDDSKVIGKLFQAKKAFEIYSKPDSSAHVYSRGKKDQYIVANYVNRSPFIRVQMTNGENGYALAALFTDTGHLVRVPSSKHREIEISSTGFFLPIQKLAAKQITGRYTSKSLLDMKKTLSKEENALLGYRLELQLDEEGKVAYHHGSSVYRGRYVYNKEIGRVTIKLESLGGKRMKAALVHFMEIGVRSGAVALIRTRGDKMIGEEYIFVKDL